MISIVTNIDADHMRTYGNDFNRLRSTFMEFLHHLPFYGLAVLCTDDDEIRALIETVPRPVRTYGTRAEADVRAVEIRQDGMRTRFRVEARDLESPLEIDLNLPGRHNVLNARSRAPCPGSKGLGVAS
jgi:UDP-N-acetylmuramate--alanine ligase